MTEAQPVRLYGHLLGHLSGDGDVARIDWSAYDAPWRRGSTKLSASVRMRVDPQPVQNFFGALLPEGQWLARLARETGEKERDVVGLLSHVGADVAGALVIGEPREATAPLALADAEVSGLLERAGGYTVGGGGSSLPGYQRKIALSKVGDMWMLGGGRLPSTHILKPVDENRSAAAHAEEYTLRLARGLGLTTFDAWVQHFGSVPVLVVERYDRAVDQGFVTRLHQEDLAAALGLPWYGDAKFERYDARASFRGIARLMDEDRDLFENEESDLEKLVRYMTFNVAVGNTDAHAKNYSLLRPERGRPRLAPLYDAAPIALDYHGSRTLAMSVNGVVYAPQVTASDLVDEAAAWGIRRSVAHRLVTDTLEHLVAQTRSQHAPAEIESHVPGFIRGQSQNLLTGKSAELRGPLPPALRSRLGSE